MHRPEHQWHVSPVVAFRRIELMDRQELEHRDTELNKPREVGRCSGERAGIVAIESHRHAASVRLGDDEGSSRSTLGLGHRPRNGNGPRIGRVPFVRLAEPDLRRQRVNQPDATIDVQPISTRRRNRTDPLAAVAPQVCAVAAGQLYLDRFCKRRPDPHVEHAAVWPVSSRTGLDSAANLDGPGPDVLEYRRGGDPS